ncbi:phosphatase PAP2 family protein [Isoptericola variabilis]|nr:phosphatase PAP2 family protein [Isoptericola variabilis]
MVADTRPLPASGPSGPVPVGRASVDVVRARTGARVVAALVALLAAVGVGLTHRVFVATAAGQRVDELAFEGAAHGQGRLWVVAEPVLDVVSVAFVVVAIGVAMLVAVARRRWVLAVQVAALVVGANVTTQLLKHQLLERPDLLPGWNGPNTLPSGHTTVAASVSVALLLATPRAWRPAVTVVGVLYTAATGVSTLVGQWHRPSDVMAALLVVLLWGAVVCAFTPAVALDTPRTPGGSLATPGSSVLAGLLLLGAAVGGGIAATTMAGLVGAWSVPFAPDVTAYAVGVLAVASVTAATFAVLLVLRQATARPAPAK